MGFHKPIYWDRSLLPMGRQGFPINIHPIEPKNKGSPYFLMSYILWDQTKILLPIMGLAKLPIHLLSLPQPNMSCRFSEGNFEQIYIYACISHPNQTPSWGSPHTTQCSYQINGNKRQKSTHETPYSKLMQHCLRRKWGKPIIKTHEELSF